MEQATTPAKILVVDDVAIFREPIAASLHHAGYSVTTAMDGQEALSLARRCPPDLILLDLAMPVMDGLTFLKELRKEAALASTPIILLSAVGEKQHLAHAAELGAKDYLLKSRFSLLELLDRVGRRVARGPQAAAAS